MKTFIDSHTLGQERTWFSDWFNSPYYHLLYRNRDEQEARFFMDNLTQALHVLPTHTLLDVACGKGRHAKYLNSKGLCVVGLDLSPESIEEARQYENDSLRFFVHDMREVFAEDSFDFVFNLFTSFGYFESENENLTAIQAMTAALRRGGKLVIDFFNPHKVIKNLVPAETKQIDDIAFHIHKSVENEYIIKKIDFDHKGHHFHFEEKVKAIDLEEFSTYCQLAGLRIVHTFGDYRLNPYEREESDRLIIVCEK